MNLWDRIIRKIQVKIFNKDQMELQIKEYRKAGIKVGRGCKIYSRLPSGRDAFLLHIGNNVTIAGNVTFFMHDNSVIKVTNGKYTDSLGAIVIGDDSFIGNGSIILPGVELARGTIVGAGSVVTKSVMEPKQVIGGNPAKIIGNWDTYMEKNQSTFVNLNGIDKDKLEKQVSAGEIELTLRAKM